ncbi:MAG: 3-keto-disaccharide hydrolase [Chthoniobacterales bacterium]
MTHPPLLSAGIAAVALAAAATAAPPGYDIFSPHPDPTRTADGAWEIHDMSRPWPPSATPKPWTELAGAAKPPAGATILFDGTSLDAWHVPHPWQIEEGVLHVNPVNLSLVTKESFGTCQLHLEWRTPPQPSQKSGQQRGNSGVFLMSNYEIQILDTHENKTYPDGMAAALYGMKPPDFNALRPAGEWQSYDILFKRPIFDEAGTMTSPAYVTVMVNGIVVQKNVPFSGPTSHKKRRPYQKHADALPIMLQNHHEAVEFRNIWVKPLPDSDCPL